MIKKVLVTNSVIKFKKNGPGNNRGVALIFSKSL